MLLYDKKIKTLDNIRSFSNLISDIKKTGNPNQMLDGDPILIVCAELGETSLVSWLISLGADINVTSHSKYSYGNTALIEASRLGFIDIVKILVENGAKLDEKNYMGNSALMVSVINRHANIVDYLIQNGAYLETQDKNNDTPLLIACAKGYKEIIELLLENGANLHHVDLDNEDAFILASKHNDCDLIKLLNKYKK